MTAVTRPRRTKTLVFGAAALVLSAVIAAGAGFWWNKHNEPSQASRADCALAQQLVDSAKEIPSDRAGIEKWEKTAQQGRAQLKDGYLAAGISNYHGLAAMKAKGGETPAGKKVLQLSDQANEHCADALVTLTFPPLSS
ncbi:hypothetical protein ACFS5L_29285 [Streptomyces phyllanthi]|uniref:Uncharacterized protein n=1 Tax=Streptomyces phyllanthi TaxID=1803180 RepID=A0A5N8VZ85_9ACTN|nr:hypothetical protein [Streptomyces phyllanthi]MPY40547.1 hypothetical protein [Streptomyces phyllanthi]